MEFELPPESSENLRRPQVVEPPKHFDFRVARGGARAANIKLVMLVLMLAGVLYAMIELGNPERWYWLVPPESGETKSEPKDVILPKPNLKSKKPDSGTQPDSALSRQSRSALDGPTKFSQPSDSAKLDPQPDREPPIKRPKLAQLDQDEYPASATRFWDSMVRRMSPEQRRNLFMLLKRIRHGQELSDKERATVEGLLASIRKARSTFHEDLMNRATYVADGPEKATLANDHFESESTWDRSEWLAISSFLDGKSLTETQQLALRRLQSALDPLMLKFVQDQSAQGWEGDSPAWGRMWERLLFEGLPSTTLVTHLELNAQPEFYRNRSIAVRGWVRGGWREDLAIPELGIEHLYVLVVRPADSKVTPYYLYAADLPAGLPNLEKKYQSMNMRIECRGLFFKIRTYLDTQKKVQTSPMILVDQIELVATGSESPSIATQELSRPYAWITGLILFPLMAGFVAWYVYRTTKTVRFQPGPNRTHEIHQSLDGLIDHPDIKTDVEKVRELYE